MDEAAVTAAVTEFKARFVAGDGKGEDELKHLDGEAIQAAAHDAFDGVNG